MRRRIRVGLAAFVVVLVALAIALVRFDRDPAELRARWSLPTSVFANVLGMQVHVSDVGAGPPVVLIHGIFDSLRTWDAVADSLDDTHRVIRFDLPGHGLTGPDPSGDYSMARSVAFVDGVTSALGVAKFSIVGNSMGGEIGWNYAGTYPEKVERLVLVDSAGQPRKQLPRIIAFARMPVVGKLLEWCLPRFMVERITRGVWAPGATIPDAAIDRFVDLQLYPGNRRALRERLSQRSDTPDLSPLTRITAPTLVVWGAEDRWIPVGDAAAFGQAIKGAEVVLYPGVGHVPQEEAPERLLVDLRRVLPTNADPPRPP